MTLHTWTLTAATLLTALSLACDLDAPDLPGEEAVRPRGGSGSAPPHLNTWKLGVSDVANIDTLGQELEGVQLLDVEVFVNGVRTSIDAGSLTVDHGALQATVGGVLRVGTEFAGSLWTFDVDSQPIVAHLGVVETAEEALPWSANLPVQETKIDPARLVYLFKWDHLSQDMVFDKDTCDYDAIGGAQTIIYGGFTVDHVTGDITARPNTLYLACLSGAVGKAAKWGYAPDSPSDESVSLQAFNTVTRIVRHDFCADGRNHTGLNKPVLLRDRWLYDAFPAGFSSYTTEARWQAGGGATCLNKIRATGEVLTQPYTCPDGTVIPQCVELLAPPGGVVKYGDFWTRTPNVP